MTKFSELPEDKKEVLIEEAENFNTLSVLHKKLGFLASWDYD